MILLNPGGLRVLSVRALIPWQGVPVFDLQLDPEVVALAPKSGPVVLTIGAPPGPVTTVKATIDPRGSGAFSSLYSMRVVAGGGGWDQTVPFQPFHSDGGLTGAAVYGATGALVGEVVQTLVPVLVGAVDFVRLTGPARRVLDREPSWWVDPTTGVTLVGPRPPQVPDASLALMFYDAGQQRAELVCDALVLPGTPIVDPRLGASVLTVRDVEQTFGPEGGKVLAWCGAAPAAQLAQDLRTMVQEFAGVKFLRSYLYRVVLQNPADGRLSLQAVHPGLGCPPLVPISGWVGMQGDAAKLQVGALVRVSFTEGDPTQPIVDSYAPAVPLERTVDGSIAVHVGPSATLVDLAGGVIPLALSPPILTYLAAHKVWSGVVATALQTLGVPIVGPQATLEAAIDAATLAVPAKKVTGT
jgi:hypothetical protein